MLNIVLIVDDYTDRLNSILDVLNKLKKSFDNRNIAMIDKFYDFNLKKKCRLFLNNSFECIRSINNFSNNITSSFQQIISDTFLFIVQISIVSMNNKNINILEKSYIDFAMFNTITTVNVIDYLKN